MLEKSSRRLQVSKIALELIRETGYQSLTMSTLGKKAGVSTGTLYREFKTKEDLLLYIFIINCQSLVDISKKFNKMNLNAKEKIICKNCFQYFVRLYKKDKASIDMIMANAGIFHEANTNFHNIMKKIKSNVDSSRITMFNELRDSKIIQATDEQIEFTAKMITTISRGTVYVVNNVFYQKSSLPIDDVLRMYEACLNQIHWNEENCSVDYRSMKTCLKTVLDRSSLELQLF